MVLEPVPSWKCASEDAEPQGGWIVTTSVDGCGALVGYLVSNPTLLECRSGDNSNVIIVTFSMPKPFLSGWF